MNKIFLNNNFNQINAIYVNINVGHIVGPPLSPPLASNTTELESNSYHSPTLSSLSSLSSESSQSFVTKIHSSYQRSVGSQWISKGLAKNAMFDPIRYKTEMCKNFIELGECRFGENCYYAHFENELKVPTYKHKNYKTELCKPFHSDGFCDFGSRCAFIHSKPDVNQILKRFHSFLYRRPPKSQIITKEELGTNWEFISKNEKRLKVFEYMSSQ